MGKGYNIGEAWRRNWTRDNDTTNKAKRGDKAPETLDRELVRRERRSGRKMREGIRERSLPDSGSTQISKRRYVHQKWRDAFPMIDVST